jgi:hypothetical protein
VDTTLKPLLIVDELTQAFIFVGVYGYSYLDGGHKAMDLFRQRGWTTIINDQLTYNVLNMMVAAIAFSAAGVMRAVVTISPSMVGGLKDSPELIWVVAAIALIIGILIASVTVRMIEGMMVLLLSCGWT